jgi:hypothetical protein
VTFLDKLWLLLSQSVNAILFGGDPDESLSARRYREGKPESIDRVLGKGHCEAVYKQQRARQTARHQDT